MTDRPIRFSAQMVRALLDGRKSQTRRLLKVQPPEPCEFAGFYSVPLSGAFQCRLHGYTTIYTQRLPYAIGDRIYVREHWRTMAALDHVAPRDMTPDIPIWYLADVDAVHGSHGRFRQGMHMPRWTSRLTLTVTDVRVQRLQEISEADAWDEGCKQGDPWDSGDGYFPAEEPSPDGKGIIGWDCASDWYADLWNSLHGPDAWDANPWVVAVSFSVQHGNIDQLAQVAT